MKKYVYPLILLLASSVLLMLIRTYTSFEGKEALLNILTLLLLFSFGASLNDHHKTREDTWLKKMIIMVVFVLVALVYLNILNISFLNTAFSFLGFTSVIYHMLFIYFGYIFFS
jgi:hypothetical protein